MAAPLIVYATRTWAEAVEENARAEIAPGETIQTTPPPGNELQTGQLDLPPSPPEDGLWVPLC